MGLELVSTPNVSQNAWIKIFPLQYYINCPNSLSDCLLSKSFKKMFNVSCLRIWWRHDIWIIKTLKFDYFMNDKMFEVKEKTFFLVSQALLFTLTHPLDWNSPCSGKGASHQQVSTRVRQREELNWALQLKSSDQQIFSTMSGTDSSLIRQGLL